MKSKLFKSATILIIILFSCHNLMGFWKSSKIAHEEGAVETKKQKKETKQKAAQQLIKDAEKEAQKQQKVEATNAKQKALKGFHDKKAAIEAYKKKINDPKSTLDDKIKALRNLAAISPELGVKARAEESARLQKIISSSETTTALKKLAIEALKKIDPSTSFMLDPVGTLREKGKGEIKKGYENLIALELSKLPEKDREICAKAKAFIEQIYKLKKAPLNETEQDKKKREQNIAKLEKELTDIKNDKTLSLQAKLLIAKPQFVEWSKEKLEFIQKVEDYGSVLSAKIFASGSTEENKKKSWPKIVLGGSGGLGIGGIITALVALFRTAQNDDAEPEKELDKLNEELENGDSPNTPSPLPDADPNSEVAQKIIPAIANFMGANLVEAFIDALKNGDYNNAKFRIELRPVTIEKVEYTFVIQYNFEDKEAGNPASPLICEVSLTPDSINESGINIDNLISLIDSEFKEACQLILKPNAAFLFFIKEILLNNDVLNDTSLNNHFDKIQKIRMHTMILCARLALTAQYANTSIQDLLSVIPSPIQKYMGDLNTKMHPEHIKSAQSVKQDSSNIQEAVLNNRSAGLSYLEKINDMNENIIPLITDGLSYNDQKLLIHVILRLISDLGDKLPKSAEDQKKELVKRIDALIPVVTSAIEITTNSFFELKDIDSLKKAVTRLNEIKSGEKTVNQNIAKPRIGEPISGIKEASLTDALDIYLQQYQKLQNLQNSGDLLLGKIETYDAIIFTFLRGIKMVSNAYETLTKSKDTSINLRNLNGAFTINPSQELEKLTQEANIELNKATQTLTKAAKDLRDDPKSKACKQDYNDAKKAVIQASALMNDCFLKFRSLYAPYLPLTLSTEGDKTAFELIKNALKNIRKLGQKNAFKAMLSEENYALFEKALGFEAQTVYAEPI